MRDEETSAEYAVRLRCDGDVCAACGEPSTEPKVWRFRTFCPPCLRIFQDHFFAHELYIRRRFRLPWPKVRA